MSFFKRFQTSLESLHEFSDNKNHRIKRYVIAYSGGVDSLVLLHCFKQLGVNMRAVHVHHGLQNAADDWVRHCQQTCEALNIQLDVLYVDAKQKPGTSPEEAARNARYQALQKNMKAGDCLVTAQHLDDQAETLLLQLFRSASAAGLAAMPARKTFGEFLHIRPLLSFSRKDIESYATQNKLQWVEDPSNRDVSYDRNFLRKEILPLLENRWPELSTQLATVASQQASNLRVLEDMASIDLANALVTQDKPFSFFKVESMLSIRRLKKLSSPRVLNLLRHWVILTLDKQPTRNLLQEIENALINSQPDAKPDIVFSGYAFRKFQDDLYLLKLKAESMVYEKTSWHPSSVLKLPGLNVQLKAIATSGEGLDKKLLDESLTIRFRQGGEKFHPAGRRHSQRLKKLLQEAGIPPWEREVLPLLYLGNQLIAVVGLWVSKDYSVDEGGWFVGVEFT